MNSFGKIAELVITILLLFFVPLQYLAIKQDAISQTYVTTETSYFVDCVRNLGYLDKEMYETFVRKISCTNHIYDIEMTHYTYQLDQYEDFYKGHYYSGNEKEIKDTIYGENKNSLYLFHQGDYFMVKVKNSDKTYGTKIQELFLKTRLPVEQISVLYGGAIKDEIY